MNWFVIIGSLNDRGNKTNVKYQSSDIIASHWRMYHVKVATAFSGWTLLLYTGEQSTRIQTLPPNLN
jgi:hypothetical protein